MKLPRTFFGRRLFVFCHVLAAGFVFTGCIFKGEEPIFTDSTRTSALSGAPGGVPNGVEVGRFAIGDQVTVNIIGLPVHEERITEDGTITMELIGPVKAAGKSAGELQKEIHDLYVPKYYTRLTVTVIPKESAYSIGGEVRQPGPRLYQGETTLTKVIQAAGDFTDFANKKKIRLTRGGKITTFNWYSIQKKPSTDPLIIPGDKIDVPRRWPG